MDRIIWQGRCSTLIYVYPYLFISCCAVFCFVINPMITAAALAILAGFALDARAKRYILHENTLTLSDGLFGNAEFELPLADIIKVSVYDPPPWQYFSCGWIFLTVSEGQSEEDELAVVLKCIANPLGVGQLIEDTAIKAGARITSATEAGNSTKPAGEDERSNGE